MFNNAHIPLRLSQYTCICCFKRFSFNNFTENVLELLRIFIILIINFNEIRGSHHFKLYKCRNVYKRYIKVSMFLKDSKYDLMRN